VQSVPPFTSGAIKSIAEVLQAFRRSEIAALLADAGLSNPLGREATKWKRLDAAMRDAQAGCLLCRVLS
jgi:hypothetical protein